MAKGAAASGPDFSEVRKNFPRAVKETYFNERPLRRALRTEPSAIEKKPWWQGHSSRFSSPVSKLVAEWISFPLPWRRSSERAAQV
jgi:hypothetical protein